MRARVSLERCVLVLVFASGEISSLSDGGD